MDSAKKSVQVKVHQWGSGGSLISELFEHHAYPWKERSIYSEKDNKYLKKGNSHIVLIREWKGCGCWKESLDWLPTSWEMGYHGCTIRTSQEE